MNGVSVICSNDAQEKVLERALLFIRRQLPLKDKSLTSISDIFHKSILTRLEQQGFMSRNAEPETYQK